MKIRTELVTFKEEKEKFDVAGARELRNWEESGAQSGRAPEFKLGSLDSILRAMGSHW
jgi:hypothetical protein